jgi:hypothetical protein
MADFCPLRGMACLGSDCAWWIVTTYRFPGQEPFKSEQCAVAKIANELDNLAGRC